MILQILISLIMLFIPDGKRDSPHPFFMSVTEIAYNSTEKTMEISCKIFTDDFEKTLRMNNDHLIDLMNPHQKSKMNNIVESYIKKHLSIKINGQNESLGYVDFDQEEEATICYFQIPKVQSVNTIEVYNDLLYEYSTQQMNIIHAIVGKERKSHRLIVPDKLVKFSF